MTISKIIVWLIIGEAIDETAGKVYYFQKDRTQPCFIEPTLIG